MPVTSMREKVRLRVQKAGRLAHFLGLATSLVTINVLSITVAESLFLSNAGAERMPYFYLLLGFISVPAAAVYSQLVDRLPKPRLLRYLLLLATGLALPLRTLLLLPGTAVFYGVYVVFTLLELLTYIQFWVLVAGYFTSLELKRYAPHIAMSTALGGLFGGGLATTLSDNLSGPNLLLLFPCIYAAAFAQVMFLERSQRELGSTDPEEEAEAGLLESLKVLPRLIQRYPLVLCLAAGTFLMTALECLAEYQVFTIYSAHYPKQEDLTAFLGKVNAALSVIEFAAIYLITRPMIQHLGVGRMNWMHPATTLASFGALGSSFSLPSAVLVNFNYVTLTHAVAEPTDALNYNGVPQRFVGRVRVVTEGLVLPAGIAIAGIALIAAENVLTPLRLTIAGLCLSVFYVVCGYWRGRMYLGSLLTMLRARSVNLDELGEGIRKLPEVDADEVHQLLISRDPETQAIGLELAARMNPVMFLGTVALLLPKAHPSLRGSLVRLYAAFHQRELMGHVRALLQSEHDMVRALALEALIVRQERLSDDELRTLLRDPSGEVRALASIAAHKARSDDMEIEQLAANERTCQDWDDSVCLAVSRALRQAEERDFIPLLLTMLDRRAGPAAGKEALETLCSLARESDTHLVDIAVEQLRDPDSRVRSSACKLLGILRCERAMDELANSLSDGELSVRQAAAEALASHGMPALPLAEVHMYSPNPEVVNAAISVIGRIHERLPEGVLYRFLEPEYRQAAVNLRWLGTIPDVQGFAGLRLIIEDSNRRILQRVLHVVGSLGHAPVVNCIRRILYSPDARLRANAIEALESLQQRRFVDPLVPLLEFEASGRISRDAGPRPMPEGAAPLLQEMLRSSDRWIKLGAATALATTGENVFGDLVWDDDPIVRQIAEEANGNLGEVSHIMNRLIFLKKVPLFRELSLDDLLGIADALIPEEFLARETVFHEGSLGQKLYIVQQGTVVIRRDSGDRQNEVARLAAGECFGEMSLVDESPRSATAVTSTPCTLLTLEKTRFLTLVAQRPAIALQLCRVLSIRLRQANQANQQARAPAEVSEGEQPKGKAEVVGN